MQIKLLEIRDRGTFIPVMAARFNGSEHRLFRAAGFGVGQPAIIVVKLTGGACAAEYDPFNWPKNPRTMHEAHLAIEKSWDSLQNGSVVDVEFELGETQTRKVPDYAD